ncbi:MAG: acyltransferase [Myxococcota bacterium]
MVGIQYPRRYELIDAWRGVASLLVVINHQFLGRSALTDQMWLGVQLFFVISGYCIAAAVDDGLQRGMSFPAFMARRVRRIWPPYVASGVVALAVAFLVGTVRGGLARGLANLEGPVLEYVQNLTLTQWVSIPASLVGGAEPPAVAWANKTLWVQVYWSLNYEEQFYLLCGVSLLLAPLVGVGRLFALGTGVVVIFNLFTAGLITGTFVDYWLQFATGVLVFLRLRKAPDEKSARQLEVLLFSALVLVATRAAWQGEWPLTQEHYQFHAQLGVCLLFGLLLVRLRPLDAVASTTTVVRLLRSAGHMSYSLYLFHQPTLKLYRLLVPAGGDGVSQVFFDVGALGFQYLVAYGLHRLVERPFLNSRPAEPVPTPSVASPARAA